MKRLWAVVRVSTVIGLAGLAGNAVRGQTVVGVANYNSSLLQAIDLTTLTVTNIGNFTNTFSYGDLAWDSRRNTLYMVDGWGGTKSLYTVNLTTGATTLVGVHGVTDMFGLAYDSANDTLYASSTAYSDGTTKLFKLNLATGAATLVGSTVLAGTSTYVGLGSLAYDSRRDMLVGIHDGNIYGELYQVDISTGALTLLATPGGNNNSGMTYDPINDRLLDADVSGYLYSYDIANGYARTTLLSGILAHDGLAFITVVPEPGVAALLGLGLLLAGLMHLRRT
jgi:hypothetical protein